ncbi:MAG TPA: HNH endonuclease signature motif containing protein, partial [Longimicrobiaceae bacterium]|nr:HNH endonuclease signature motif containing protein [Longimicrobiaceae bacterium]
SRLQPVQLRRLGAGLGGDPGPAVARAIRRLTSGARRVGTFRERRLGRRYPVFAVRGYRLLVRPLGPLQGEILTLAPQTAGPEKESGEAPPAVPRRLRGRERDRLRSAARAAYFQAYPRQRGRAVEVHHRVPLEWSHLFPGADPNRLSNLQGLSSRDHLRKASDLWTAFRNTYQRRREAPKPVDVLRYAAVVDRSLALPYPL